MCYKTFVVLMETSVRVKASRDETTSQSENYHCTRKSVASFFRVKIMVKPTECLVYLWKSTYYNIPEERNINIKYHEKFK
jgi:hypothetical protein